MVLMMVGKPETTHTHVANKLQHRLGTCFPLETHHPLID